MVFESGVMTSMVASSDATSFASYSSQTVAPSSTPGASVVGVECTGVLWMDRVGMTFPCCFRAKRKFCQKFSGRKAEFWSAEDEEDGGGEFVWGLLWSLGYAAGNIRRMRTRMVSPRW